MVGGDAEGEALGDTVVGAAGMGEGLSNMLGNADGTEVGKVLGEEDGKSLGETKGGELGDALG
eukprot:CAMPEP_0113581230 /NCGR_PEP_ID=MMETSP0015_2-20120614/31161_1 /TAXON_ID=2838 /ORGANISM="Odontella" /LENGTH=62 /DNA_ID=CAMNT_0000485603 /DNA_START=605 /DNA_END=793 /DNA_ORIENTATION=+ /assembly_acc=CAM_ASM_000160